MTETSILPYEGYSANAELAIVTPAAEDYLVQCGTYSTQRLKRDVDFGVIPKTKKPSLFKSGAEKIAMGYGLLQHYTLIDRIIPPPDSSYGYALYRCDLVKVVHGKEYVLSNGYASANTHERRNGLNDAYNSDNSTHKIAQKRALVAAALAISGLSDAFTQDMENEEFMAKGKDLLDTDRPDSPISTAQIRRLYAIGGEAGLTSNEVKQFLISQGFESTKKILQKDYNTVCELVAKRAMAASNENEKEINNDKK